MNKPKLIKRGEVPQSQIAKPTPTVAQTVAVVKDWLNTRHQSTKQNARETFSRLFVSAPETCTEC